MKSMCIRSQQKCQIVVKNGKNKNKNNKSSLVISPVSDVLVLPLLACQRVPLTANIKFGVPSCLVRHTTSRLLHPAAKSNIFQLLPNKSKD